MRDFIVIRVIAKTLIPVILVFALYVQLHGDYGPGGGFQAGVIFSAGFILYGLVFGLDALHKVIPVGALQIFAALGVLIYAGTGIACLVLGGNFLNYNVLSHDPVQGQHLGILLIELGVGLTVASVMLILFQVFAGKRRAL